MCPWLPDWYAHATGERGQPGQRLSAVSPEEILDYATHRRTVADFVPRAAFCREQSPIARFRFAPLVVSTGDIDPVPALPFSGRYG